MSFVHLVLAAALLFLSHAVPSAPGIRPRLVGVLGRRGFMVAYSLLSTATLGLFVYGYVTVADAPGPWPPLPGSQVAAIVLMPVAFVFVAYRVTTPFGEPGAPLAPTGIYRVCRFPGSLGLSLWAVLHLAATGDGRRLVLFVTMLAIALYAMAKNDLVLRRGGPEARAFRAATGIMPFAAIAGGRQRFAGAEIGWGRLVLAFAAYAVLLLAHPWLFGVAPLDYL